MIKEIKYTGLTATPSDYECPDGTIAGTMSLIHEDGAIKPIATPKTIMQLPNLMRVLYIHQVGQDKHYITFQQTILNLQEQGSKTTNTLYWYVDGTGIKQTIYTTTSAQIYQVTAIGNTLIALTSEGMHYSLWKEGQYVSLGNHLPELSLSFGLQGTKVHTTETFNIGGVEETSRPGITDVDTATNDTLGQVNKFLADNVDDAGMFLYPFFVRYAYRLYDGSLTMHSAPILMTTTTKVAPYVIGDTIENGYLKNCHIYAILHKLDFAAIIQDQLTQLADWEDIIRSVDIFISQPLYSYDQSGKLTNGRPSVSSGNRVTVGASSLKRLNNGRSSEDLGYTISRGIVYDDVNTQTSGTYYYKKHSVLDLLAGGATTTIGNYYMELPQKDSDTIIGNIKDCSLFYYLKSYKISEIPTKRTVVEIKSDYLRSLVTREVMTDDYDSHDTLAPKHANIYNARINVANLSKELFKGYNPASILPYTNGGYRYKDQNGNIVDAFDAKETVTVVFHIQQDNKIIKVSGGSYDFSPWTPITYLFYPNVNAFKAVIARVSDFGEEINKYYEVPLEPHPMLNGAYYYKGWDDVETKSDDDFLTDFNYGLNKNLTVELPNKIYTSEINNPFHFPVRGINTVGVGRIIGICSAAKALSEGQFGQFPLYAFTDEGVWALEVSSTGTYSAKQPITRDVCISSKSITQLDNAVLFATKRGIMLLSGSQSSCITDILNGKEFSLTTIMSNDARDILVDTYGLPNNTDTITFEDYITDCRMLYDYKGQRIVLYNPNHTYAYVHSMRSKLWGMMPSNFTEPVNAYPDAYVMTSDNALVNVSEDDAITGTQCIITRPLKLDAPDVLKTISTIIQRGQFAKGHVKQVLYASRDLIHWIPVWSSTDHYLRGFSGTPYKYFRILVIANLEEGESIDGCSIQYEQRLTNRLR
ncbi:MAG: hypothetical protein IKJ09_00740 [Bacteroidaceae bacterium]|nr:hypothetical protein [Bacteroidaceae bacterium]